MWQLDSCHIDSGNGRRYPGNIWILPCDPHNHQFSSPHRIFEMVSKLLALMWHRGVKLKPCFQHKGCLMSNQVLFVVIVKGESTSGTREGFAASQIVYRLFFVSYWFIFERQGTTSNVHWSLTNNAEFDRKRCCVMIFSDWRRTDHHTMQEAKLLNILHCLKDKQRETCWTEKLGEQLPIPHFRLV